MKPKLPKPAKEPQQVPGVHPGDHIYVRHKSGPYSGRVLCHGQHGVTVEDHAGNRQQVAWSDILGHKKRVRHELALVERGEDGFIGEGANGNRVFVAGQIPPKEKPMKKSLPAAMRGMPLLFKSVRPGLVLKEETDKQGHVIHRWEQANPDQPGQKQRGAAKPQPTGAQHGPHNTERGHVVNFHAGSFKGKGKVTAVGADGVTVQDDAGREHSVHYHEIKGKEQPKPAAAAGDGKGSSQASAQAKKPEVDGDSIGIPEPLFDEKETADLPMKANQPVKEPEELWAKSREALTSYDKLLTDVCSGLGIEKANGSPDDADFSKPGGLLFVAPLKGMERAREKVENKYKGDWSRLCDVVRASIAVDTLDDLKSLMGKLKAGGLQLAASPDDRFHTPTSVGYADVNMNVKLSNGLIGELQLHVKPMLDAKRAGHKPYEVIRKIEESKPEEEWTPEEHKAHDDAVAESKAIYGAAWKRIRGGNPTGGDSETMSKSIRRGNIMTLLWRVS